MSREHYVPLWWVPLLVALAPVVGLSPAPRDIIDFFAPIRAMTASSLAAGVMPWLNFANGCGEAWFANPETAVLYPPAWVHLILPPVWAMALEIGLHLAWLALGVGLLARHLGAGPLGRSAAETAAWSVGPVIFTVGVLNNLETLAWVPWMVLAARVPGRRATALVAMTTALAWLGGEPQLWALAVVLTFVAARSRIRAVVGLALGSLLVAVQMVPFVFWVLEGDRGPQAASWVLRGALTPADWGGLLVPGLPNNPDRMIFVESLFFRRTTPGLWAARRVASKVVVGRRSGVWSCGDAARNRRRRDPSHADRWAGRYPSRFALAGLALLLPMVGCGAEDWLAGRGRWLAAVFSSLAIAAVRRQFSPIEVVGGGNSGGSHVGRIVVVVVAWHTGCGIGGGMVGTDHCCLATPWSAVARLARSRR